MIKKVTSFQVFLLITSIWMSGCNIPGHGETANHYGEPANQEELIGYLGKGCFETPSNEKPGDIECVSCMNNAIPEDSSSEASKTFNIGKELAECSKSCSSPCVSKLNQKTDVEISRGTLSFENPSTRFQGKCRGHTIINQQMNTLGVYCNFNDNDVRDCSGGSPKKKDICLRKKVCESDPEYLANKDCKPNTSVSCNKFYENIIDDIIKGNKVRAVPGYTNLYDFSNDFKEKLIDHAQSVNAKYSASSSIGVQDENQTGFQTGGKADKSVMFKEISRRIIGGHYPYIGIAGNGKNGASNIGAHAIMGYKVVEEDGEQRICVRDPNIKSVEEDCSNYIINDGSDIKYIKGNDKKGAYAKLNTFGFMSDEDRRVRNYGRAWKNICETIGPCNT